jgi:group I intron endonuclease
MKNNSFTPIVLYENINTDRSRILSDNKGLAGIYQWTHLESGKIYVGSAVNLSERLKDYFTLSYISDKTKGNSYIYNALLLHGYSGFSLSILEFIDISNLSKKEARKLILEREQYYLGLIFKEAEPNTYNILPTAGSSLGYKHTEVSKELISKANLGKVHSVETRSKMSEALSGLNSPRGFLGKSHSLESKALMSAAKAGENNPKSFLGKIHTEEIITKLSIAKGGGTIYMYDTQGTLLNTFSSARKAAEHFNTSHITIMKYVRNGNIFKDKWKFSTFLIIE